MGKSGQRFQSERYERGGVADETGDCFGNDATLLCERTPFHKHLQVQPFGSQTLKCILADGAEVILTHIAEKTILEVHFAEVAGVIVAKDALDMGGGQNLTDDIEDGVVVER